MCGGQVEDGGKDGVGRDGREEGAKEDDRDEWRDW